MNYRLLAVDLDGTLLTPFKSITSKDLNSLKKYNDAGGTIILCSGRAKKSMKHYVEQVNNAINSQLKYVIAFSGAMILNEKQEVIRECLIKHNVTKAMIDYCVKNHLFFWLHNRHAAENNAVYINNAFLRIYCRIIKRMHAWKFDANKISDYNAYKINVYSPSKEKIRAFYKFITEKFNDDLEIFATGKNEYEIIAHGISKGEAMSYLAEKNKISLNEVASIGDSGNDLSNAKVVKMSASIGNHSAELKLYSAVNIKNHRNAVSYFIENHLLKENRPHIQMLATDLDGTLLNDEKNIDENTINVIQKHFGKAFKYFVVSTGRNVSTSHSIFKKLHLTHENNCFIVANNGTIIYELGSHQVYFFQEIPHPIAKQLFDFIVESSKKIKIASVVHHFNFDQTKHLLMNERNTEYPIHSFNKDFFVKKLNAVQPNFFCDYNPIDSYIEASNIDDIRNIAKFIVYFDNKTDKDNWVKSIEEFNLPIVITSSGDSNIEINYHTINKGMAIKQLAKQLNISPYEILITGDELNDLSMLKLTEWSYTYESTKQEVKNMTRNILNSGPSKLVADAINDYLKNMDNF
ncbi:MAG: haloacid dehalogenase-like hydrolase [Candidatus Malacoplasma girerdii]|nr:MAG: haloacid dehalogenase-like hydrolase [Candidatus Malacoplasma girerdii]